MNDVVVLPAAKVAVPDADWKSEPAVAVPATVVQLTDVAAAAGLVSESVTVTGVRPELPSVTLASAPIRSSAGCGGALSSNAWKATPPGYGAFHIRSSEPNPLS